MRARTAYLIALFFAGLALISFGLSSMYGILEQHRQENLEREERRLEQAKRTLWRPDIRHCFRSDSIDLWDCVRNAKTDYLPSPVRGSRLADNEVGVVDGEPARETEVVARVQGER